jgi:hypothetical protein
MLGLSLTVAPSAQAKAKITKPSAPTVASISSSAPNKGKVNVMVTITLPSSDGGSKITASTVSAGGKSCKINKLKTSCTIKGIKNGKSLSVIAKSKNKKGFSSKSVAVSYVSGSAKWSIAPTPTPTPTAAPTDLGGGIVYAVGDTGPGGGIVYYVDPAGFNCGSGFTATGSPTGGKCKYLEVAPSDIFIHVLGWAEKPWAGPTRQSTDVPGITNDDFYVYNNSLGIGLGYKNSVLIVAQNGNYRKAHDYNMDMNLSADEIEGDYAAGAARAYAGNSKSDWYLPTSAELNLLCQWNRGVPQNVEIVCAGGTTNSGAGASGAIFAPRIRTGMFTYSNTTYMSSSEVRADCVSVQDFENGQQGVSLKSNGFIVRPVRAF